MSKTIALTVDQLIDLETYILMTTGYRKREIGTWEKLAEERKEDGQPRFPKAEDNVRFLKEMDARLTEIVAVIDEFRPPFPEEEKS